MDVGMSLLFQNDGYLNSETDAPPGDDRDVYRRDIELAQMAEPLGFDSLWAVEHHFTGYAMVPETLQFLAFMAGQTTNIRLGSMVLVLPWHNPARVADSIAMLDNLSGGRFTLGIGRGVGKIEFEGMGVPMEESRERFVECAELVLEGLEQGFVEYTGKHLQQPKRFIRPAPRAPLEAGRMPRRYRRSRSRSWPVSVSGCCLFPRSPGRRSSKRSKLTARSLSR